jgi:hypothetical protein
MRSSLGNKRVWKLQRVLGEVGSTRIGSDDGRRVELRMGVHGAGGGSVVARARGGVLHFIGADTCEGGRSRHHGGQVAAWRGYGGDVGRVRRRRQWSGGAVGASRVVHARRVARGE